MKSLLLVASLALAGCLHAQTEVRLLLSPRLGAQPFALNTPLAAATGYQYSITRLEYYVSEIVILHDGGQITAVPDLWLLIQPVYDSLYSLGLQNVDVVEGIQFSLGVDSAHNHLDPSTYEQNHPLAPHNPSMHWGWASGYRFAAYEGLAGPDGNPANIFQIHTVGDQNYQTVYLAAGAEAAGEVRTIRLTADYGQLLENINASNGLLSHGSGGIAATLMSNLKNLVFSAATTAQQAPAFSGSFGLAANPSTDGQIRLNYSLPAGSHYQVTIDDITGRQLTQSTLPVHDQSFTLPNRLRPGLYLVRLWQNGRSVAVEKALVTP